MKQEVLTPNLKGYNNWEKQWVHEFNKRGQETVYVRCEWDQFYGELITAFQFGDIPKDLPVHHRVSSETYPFCPCCESSSLVGERAFEKGSITYEFLWKPLQLNLEYAQEGSLVSFTSYEGFRKAMIEAGWSHTEG